MSINKQNNTNIAEHTYKRGEGRGGEERRANIIDNIKYMY